MSSWGLLKSGSGWSQNQASPVLSEKTSIITTPSTAAQTKSVSESVISSTPMRATELAKSKPLEVTRTMAESTSKLTSELLSRAAMDTRAIEIAGAEDDALRLLRWEAEAQQVDKGQSEVMRQQWRLFCEQVAMLSSKTVSMRGQIQDLYRLTNQEESERRATVEAVQVALRVSEERIFGMLEDLSRNQVSGMELEMERAGRISACKKITDELEAEKSARLGACGELASDFSRLRNTLEESLQKSATFMLEQSSIIETRMRETDFAVRQSVRHLEGRVEACQVGERSLEEKFLELHTFQAEFASKSEIMAVRKELERETTKRIRVDRELGNADGVVKKTELQALRHEFKQELAEKMKGNEKQFDTPKQGLEQELAERVKADECLDALKQGLDDLQKQLEQERKVRTAGDEQMGKLLTEGIARLEKADSEQSEILREVVEKSMREATTNLEQQLEQEVKARIASAEQWGKLFTDGLEQAGRGQSEIICMVDSIEVKIMQMCRRMLEDELKVRVQGDAESIKNLRDGLEKDGRERSEVVESACEKLKVNLSELASTVSGNESDFNAAIVDLTAQLEGLTSTVQADAVFLDGMEGKLEQSCTMLRAEIDQALSEVVASLKVEISALSGKKDALDTITREMRVEVEEQKQRTDKECLLIHKNIQDYKAQHEEYKEEHEGAHRSLQADMDKTWKSEITQLKLDQDLVLQRLQVDYDNLRTQQEELAAHAWKQDVRRLWEAMTSHRHDVAVMDFEEREEPTKNVIRREIFREAPCMQTSPTQNTRAGYHRCQEATERVGIAAVSVLAHGMVASTSINALTGVNSPVAVRAAPRMASPPRSPVPAQGSPARLRPSVTMTPPAPLSPAPSQKVLGMIRPAAVERHLVRQESSDSSLHSTQTALLDLPNSSVAVSALGSGVLGGMKKQGGSPTLTTRRVHAASMGRAIHDVRSPSISSVTDRTEEVLL